MKRIDIFCASQASTAICHSMDQASCSSSNTIQLGGRAIDRYNPIINDSSRRSTSKSVTAPCSSSQPPIDPKPRKSSSSKPYSQNKKGSIKDLDQKKKNTAEKSTPHVTSTSKPIDGILKKGWLKPPSNSITPPGSTRSLLSDTAISNGSSDFGQVLPLNKIDIKMAQVVGQDEKNPVSKPCPKSDSSDQVVVLRVSLHCKGCEGKVRKHLSRMQGVTSFNIDFAAKKVTVVGDVTPLSVLASLSKVKNAQLWPTSASAGGSGILETRNTNFSN